MRRRQLTFCGTQPDAEVELEAKNSHEPHTAANGTDALLSSPNKQKQAAHGSHCDVAVAKATVNECEGGRSGSELSKSDAAAAVGRADKTGATKHAAAFVAEDGSVKHKVVTSK